MPGVPDFMLVQEEGTNCSFDQMFSEMAATLRVKSDSRSVVLQPSLQDWTSRPGKPSRLCLRLCGLRCVCVVPSVPLCLRIPECEEFMSS